MTYIIRHNGLLVFISCIKENYEIKKKLYEGIPGYEFMELTDEQYDEVTSPKEDN